MYSGSHVDSKASDMQRCVAWQRGAFVLVDATAAGAWAAQPAHIGPDSPAPVRAFPGLSSCSLAVPNRDPAAAAV